MATNQFDEADRTTAAAVAHDVARIEIHQLRFQLAFLRADHAAMDVERKAFTVEGDDYVAEWDSKIAASQASARLERHDRRLSLEAALNRARIWLAGF